MRTRRQIVLDWLDRGLIASQHVPRALVVSGVYPSPADWRRFLDQLLLWLGALMLAAGVIFFFAYNWNDLGRFAKFGLVEGLIVIALGVIGRIGLDRLPGKVTLLAASLFVGALLALIGQTYQTGADTFELFAAWALLILPWVLVGRLAVLWLVWIGLLNLATVFCYRTFGGLFGMLFAPKEMLWILFALNTVPLVVWEWLASRTDQSRWPMRLLFTVSGGFATALALYSVVDLRANGGMGLLAWAAFLVVAYVVYRHIVLDMYALATGALSAIIVIATWLAVNMLTGSREAGGLLFIGLVVIGLSAVAGWWLKQVGSEMKS